MDFFSLTDFIQKIIDRVLLFKDRKIRSNEKMLTEVLDPLFSDLVKVVEDYFIIFHTAKHLLLAASGKNIEESVSKIRVMRDANLTFRIKTRELISILSTEYPTPYMIKFVKRVEKFFYSTQKEVRKASQTVKLITDLYEYIDNNEIDKSELLANIDFTLKKMEENWSGIVQSYARIRIKLIKAKFGEKVV